MLSDSSTSGAANQMRAREYNERLLLSLIRRHGSLSSADIAKRSGLSAQAISVIIRSLENDGLLLRGDPVRGRVGQPSIPLSLNPDGAFSIGLKIGRRSVELTMLDFTGGNRYSAHLRYRYPQIKEVMEFLREHIDKINKDFAAEQLERIVGIGVSMPFELWKWADQTGAPVEDMLEWKSFDLTSGISELVDYPVFFENDMTAACGAELMFGRGSELSDFIYFFIGTFIGGGVVINHSVFRGRTGNAGAVGSMPATAGSIEEKQLVDFASIVELERKVRAQNKDPSLLWDSSNDWSSISATVDEWIDTASGHLSVAITSSCAVLDFSAAVIDGDIPSNVLADLVGATEEKLKQLNLTGLNQPSILAGYIGSEARAMGSACLPLISRYLLDQSVLFGTARSS